MPILDDFAVMPIRERLSRIPLELSAGEEDQLSQLIERVETYITNVNDYFYDTKSRIHWIKEAEGQIEVALRGKSDQRGRYRELLAWDEADVLNHTSEVFFDERLRRQLLTGELTKASLFQLLLAVRNVQFRLKETVLINRVMRDFLRGLPAGVVASAGIETARHPAAAAETRFPPGLRTDAQMLERWLGADLSGHKFPWDVAAYETIEPERKSAPSGRGRGPRDSAGRSEVRAQGPRRFGRRPPPPNRGRRSRRGSQIQLPPRMKEGSGFEIDVSTHDPLEGIRGSGSKTREQLIGEYRFLKRTLDNWRGDLPAGKSRDFYAWKDKEKQQLAQRLSRLTASLERSGGLPSGQGSGSLEFGTQRSVAELEAEAAYLSNLLEPENWQKGAPPRAGDQFFLEQQDEHWRLTERLTEVNGLLLGRQRHREETERARRNLNP